jgi:uncharacterized membrane protein YcaP (DUF421 family)
MDPWFGVDWQGLLIPEHSVFEMFLRGTIMYLGLFVLLRFFGRRPAGSMTTADLLMIVLLADAAQNGMADDYKSVTEGFIVVSTIIGWNYAIDWLADRSKVMSRILHPPALPLICDGELQRRNMRREMITEDELLSQLREAGVDSPKKVKLAQLEGDGQMSVIRKDDSGEVNTRRKKGPQIS